MCLYFDILDPILKDHPSTQSSAKFDNSAASNEVIEFPKLDESSIEDPDVCQCKDHDDVSSDDGDGRSSISSTSSMPPQT